LALTPTPLRGWLMFDFAWLVLIFALFGVGIAYLKACERM
jgi:hypothetical protein